MSKMGISTVQSYRGAQIFEAVGLNRERRSTATSPGPRRASRASASTSSPRSAPRATTTPTRCRRRSTATSIAGGQYQWRRRGEFHMYNPETHRQAAARRARGQLRDCSRSTRALVDDQSATAVHAARPAAVQARHADPARGGRAGRARSSSASRPARCRSARSAARRTRTWPSP